MKRRRIIRNIGAGTAVILAGCTGGGDGGDGGGATATDTPASDGGDGSSDGTDTETQASDVEQLNWWNIYISDPRKKLSKQTAEGFKAEFGIPVKRTTFENTAYKSSLSSGIGSSNGPDIFLTFGGPGRLGKSASSEDALTLDDKIDDSFLETFIPGALNKCRFKNGKPLTWGAPDGELYALPHAFSGILLWYNKNVLQKAGVDPERVRRRTDLTWTEFLDICETVKGAGMTPITAGNRFKWVMAQFMSAFFMKAVGTDAVRGTAYGTNDMQWTDDPYVEALGRLKSLQEKGYFNKGINSLNRVEAAQLLFNDSAAFYHQGTWMPALVNSQTSEGDPGIPDKYDYLWWPTFPDMYSGGSEERLGALAAGTAVSRQAKERGRLDAALQFMDYYFSDEVSKNWIETAATDIPRPGVWESMDLNATQRTVQQAIADLLEGKRTGFMLEGGLIPEAQSAMLSGGQQLFSGKSPQQVLQSIQDAQDKAIDSYR